MADADPTARPDRKTGSLAVALGGLDVAVFTGGTGENAAIVRADFCRRLAFLGLEVDAGRNARGYTRIDRYGSTVPLLVIPAEEERQIVREAARITDA